MAECEADFALPVGVDVLLFYIHFAVVAEHSFNHRRHFRGGGRLELRVDADRIFLHVPVDHYPWPAVAHMPFSDQILVPGAKLLRVRSTPRGTLAPKIGIPGAES